MTTFFLQCRFDRSIVAQGMRPACLAEAAQQHVVRRFQENDFGRDHAADRLQNVRQVSSLAPSRTSITKAVRRVSLRLNRQFGKLRNQLDRQVVDAVVAEVLEGLKDRSLPGTTHAGDDDQFRRASSRRASSLTLLPTGESPSPP